MEIKTQYDIKHSTNYHPNKQWVALDEDVKQALALYWHLKRHLEIKNDWRFTDEPMCKICNKTANEILSTEGYEETRR